MKTENDKLQNDGLIKFEVRFDELIEVGQALSEHTNFQLFEKVYYVSTSQSVLLFDKTESYQKVIVNIDRDFVTVIHDGIEINLSISNWNSLCQLVQNCISKVDEVMGFIKKT